MIDKLDESLNFQSTALTLRAQRQQVLASNIANSDTPNYQARDFDFAKALSAATGGASASAASGGLIRTNALHLGSSTASAGGSSMPDLKYRSATQPSLDNNSVDIDIERAQFADNAVRYEASLTFLNQKIKSLLTAIQS